MEPNQIDAFEKIIGELEEAIKHELVPIRAFFFKDILLQVKALKYSFVALERTAEKEEKETNK